jgi:hypothetical protein
MFLLGEILPWFEEFAAVEPVDPLEPGAIDVIDRVPGASAAAVARRMGAPASCSCSMTISAPISVHPWGR